MIPFLRGGARRLLEGVAKDSAVTLAVRIDPMIELRGASNMEPVEKRSGVQLGDAGPFLPGVRRFELADVARDLGGIQRELPGSDHDAAVPQRLTQLVDRLLQRAAARVVGIAPQERCDLLARHTPATGAGEDRQQREPLSRNRELPP